MSAKNAFLLQLPEEETPRLCTTCWVELENDVLCISTRAGRTCAIGLSPLRFVQHAYGAHLKGQGYQSASILSRAVQKEGHWVSSTSQLIQIPREPPSSFTARSGHCRFRPTVPLQRRETRVSAYISEVSVEQILRIEVHDFDKDQKYALAKAHKGEDVMSMSLARALSLSIPQLSFFPTSPSSTKALIFLNELSS